MDAREKDKLFQAQVKSGVWPQDSCEKCLHKYYACKTCGHSQFTKPDQPRELCSKCHRGVLVYTETRICCERFCHHLYDCCLHCGNDERNTRNMKFRGV
jgi:hypothetical protein